MADDTQEEVEETQPEGEETEVQPEALKEEPKETTEEIPVRSNASYIIERKNRQIEKLRSQVEEEHDPIAERLDRIEELALGNYADKDLNELFEREPDAKKYASKIKAYMEHDVYKGVSPEVIYHHLDYSEAKARKDSKRKAADLEAEQTRTVGSGIRDTRSSNTKTAEDIRKMSHEEFMEYDREMMRNARS